MELKHWRVKFKNPGDDEPHDMTVDGDVQDEAGVQAHLKHVMPEAQFVSAEEGYAEK